MLSFMNELLSLSLMAFAVGMDAFSVGFGMGMIPLGLKQIMKIGFTVGAFHIWMPLAGIITGKILSEKLGLMATYGGGLLLIFIGIHMFLSSFRDDDKPGFHPVGRFIHVCIKCQHGQLFTGLTLGIFGAKTIMAIILFGIFATILTQDFVR